MEHPQQFNLTLSSSYLQNPVSDNLGGHRSVGSVEPTGSIQGHNNKNNNQGITIANILGALTRGQRYAKQIFMNYLI